MYTMTCHLFKNMQKKHFWGFVRVIVLEQIDTNCLIHHFSNTLSRVSIIDRQWYRLCEKTYGRICFYFFFSLQHIERTFHDHTGYVYKHDSGLLHFPFDRNSIAMLKPHMPILQEATLTDCRGPYCGWPYYFPLLTRLKYVQMVTFISAFFL